MANRRMMASDIFEDDFVGSLSFFERLVWIGLFGAVCDDQGRALDNPAVIRARVFPYDASITDDKVDQALVKAAKAGKIIRYEAKGKRLLQISQWWKYQTPSWASPSKHCAPSGWVDRIKYHSTGNKIVSINWDNPGGYVDDLSSNLHDLLPSTLPSDLPSTIEYVNDDVKGEGEGEGELINHSKTEEKMPSAAPEGAKEKIPFFYDIQPEKSDRFTLAQRKFLGYFGAGRFKTKVQADLIIRMEEEYGESQLTEFCLWASKNGFSLSKACGSVEGALKNWSKKQNGHHGKNGIGSHPTRGVAAALEALRDLEEEKNGSNNQIAGGGVRMLPEFSG